MLAFIGVTKSYREGDQTRTICRDLDFTITPGEKIAILGRSGTGKSTLLNLMAGLDLPDRGTIMFNQQPFNQLSDNARTRLRRQMMGVVFQFFNLIPTLTALENVLLPLSLNHTLTRRSQEQACHLLDRLQLTHRMEDYPEHLSGGEQQRVAIARALIHQPKIVFADEPTGNLDTETAQDVLHLLQSLAEKNNTTLVIVSHAQQVTQYVDRIFVMDAGQLVEQ